jgi:hypothetical protein
MSIRLITNTEVLAQMLQDPQFRAEWERTRWPGRWPMR